MTSFINRRHKQTIVFWNETGRDTFGKSTFAAPVEIMGRWEDRQINFTDNTGKEGVSSAVVFLGQDIKAGDWIYLGELTDIASAIDETNPNKVEGAKEIRGIKKIPTLKANKFLRMALLSPR